MTYLAATSARNRHARKQPRAILLKARRALQQLVARIRRQTAQSADQLRVHGRGRFLRLLALGRDPADEGAWAFAWGEGGRWDVACLRAEVRGDGHGAEGVAQADEREEFDFEIAEGC